MSAISKLKTIAGKAPMVRTLYKAFTYGIGPQQTYESDFIEFVAERRGIRVERARAMVETAQQQFAGGWGGDAYRKFSDQALETFRPVYDDSTDAELIATYKFHAPLDFLRMLGYVVPTRKHLAEIIDRLSSKPVVDIVDYGCGLSHRVLAIARHLTASGVKVKVNLVDIRKELHGNFLDFLYKKYGIAHEFIEVEPNNLYPELPPHDYCDNVSVLEHVREPLRVVDNTHRALRPGGLFLAYVADQEEEMMHISPDLSDVRRHIQTLGYTQVAKVQGVPLFRRSDAS